MSEKEEKFGDSIDTMLGGDFTGSPEFLMKFLGGVFFDKIENEEGKISHHAKVAFCKQGVVEICFDDRSFLLINELVKKRNEQDD